jgi:hypothetical protein
MLSGVSKETNVVDPDPHVLGLRDKDPKVRGKDPDPFLF